MDQAVIENDNKKKEIINDIQKLKEKLKDIDDTTHILIKDKSNRLKSTNKKVNDLNLKKKQYIEYNLEYNKYLEMYKKAGQLLIEKSGQIKNVSIFTNESLIPNKLCQGDYYIENNNCFCKGDDNNPLPCHPNSCKLSTKCNLK